MSGDQKTIIKGGPSQYVKLNVGGHLFYVSWSKIYCEEEFVIVQTYKIIERFRTRFV